jgi:hypothetical protein
MKPSTLAVGSLYTAEAGFQVVVAEQLTLSVAITASEPLGYLTNSNVLPLSDKYFFMS